MSESIGNFFASLGLQLDDKEWSAGQEAIKQLVDGIKKLEVSRKIAKAAGPDVSKALGMIGLPAVKSGLSLEHFNKATEGARRALGKFLKIGAAAAVGVLYGVERAVAGTIELGGKLADLSAQSGLAATALQEYGYASSLGGVSTEEFASSVGKFSRTLVEAKAGSKTAADALGKVHIKGAALKAALASSDGLDAALMEVADSFADMPDGARKTALAMDIFGKSGAQLLPTLNLGGDGIAQLRKEARELGIVLDDKAVAGLDDLGDTIDKVKATAGGLKNQVVAALAPALLEVATGALAWLKANREVVKSGIHTFVNVLVGGFRVLGTVISYVVDVVRFLAAHSKPLLIVLAGIAAAFTAIELAAAKEAIAAAAAWVATLGPTALIALAIGLVGAAIAAIALYWDDVKAAAAAAWRGIKSGASAALDFLRSIPGRVIGAFASMGRAIADVFETIYDNIRSGFAAAFDFIGDLPVIKQLIWMIKKLESLTGIAGSVVSAATGGRLSMGGKALPTRENPDGSISIGMNAPIPAYAPFGNGAPAVPRTGAAGGTRQVIGDINTTIQVTGTGDSAETAQRTKQAFDDNMATIMRHVRDSAGGGR